MSKSLFSTARHRAAHMLIDSFDRTRFTNLSTIRGYKQYALLGRHLTDLPILRTEMIRTTEPTTTEQIVRMNNQPNNTLLAGGVILSIAGSCLVGIYKQTKNEEKKRSVAVERERETQTIDPLSVL